MRMFETICPPFSMREKISEIESTFWHAFWRRPPPFVRALSLFCLHAFGIRPPQTAKHKIRTHLRRYLPVRTLHQKSLCPLHAANPSASAKGFLDAKSIFCPTNLGTCPLFPPSIPSIFPPDYAPCILATLHFLHGHVMERMSRQNRRPSWAAPARRPAHDSALGTFWHWFHHLNFSWAFVATRAKTGQRSRACLLRTLMNDPALERVPMHGLKTLHPLDHAVDMLTVLEAHS